MPVLESVYSEENGERLADYLITAAIHDHGSRIGGGDCPRHKVEGALAQRILEYLAPLDRDEVGAQQPLQPAMFEFVRKQVADFSLEVMFKGEALESADRTI
ncbi:MAG: hypothetical protein MK097_15055, partial [Dechloromonas sp.]|nr:hypothetical protein [Dechloromonas sp.]